MTTTTSTRALRPRWAGLLLAALAAVLALVLPPGTASASGLPAAQTRVGVSTLAAPDVVGVHECITAGQRRVRGPSQLQVVSGHCGAAEDVVDVAASRVKLRVGTKAEVRGNAPRTADGDFIDPNTGQVIPQTGPFQYGHRPGFEWWRTQQTARQEGWTRRQLIEYENNPNHFQIEDPMSNMSHMFELPR